MLSSKKSSGSSLLGLSSQGFNMMSPGTAQEGQADTSMASIFEKAGTVGIQRPVQDSNGPYVPPSQRTREQQRQNSTRSQNSRVPSDLMEILDRMPSRPSLYAPAGGAQEQKAEVEFETPGDFLFRDAKKTPEERRAVYRIRQPMSPMIHQLLKQKEAEQARLEESQPVYIRPAGTQKAVAYVLQALEETHQSSVYVGVGETFASRVWGDKVYLFDFEHPSSESSSFSFSLDYATRHSVDSIDAESIVEIELPPVTVKHSNGLSIPWCRVIIVSLTDGNVSRLWAPLHDGKGNTFIGNMQRITDYVVSVAEATKQEMAPMFEKVDALFAALQRAQE